MNKVVIIVKGGIVQAVHANEDLQVVIIDHDNLEEIPQKRLLSEATSNYSLDSIGQVQEVIDEEIKEIKDKFDL